MNGIVNKLYIEDIISNDESALLQQELPLTLNEKDSEGVSVFSKAKFSHNMVPIFNAFCLIKFSTLIELLGLEIDEILILL